LNGSTRWDDVLGTAIDVVVHLAAQIPLSADDQVKCADSYHEVNSLGTAHLARRSAANGVRRFVFMSTIKVLGEGQDAPYRTECSPAPADPYAISKWEAEQALMQIGQETGMEIVILRAPLVYGPGVKGNFLRLMQTIDKGIPLPFGAIHNRRSLIYLGNLVDAIRICLAHPAAAGKVYLVSDREDVSTPELIRRIAATLGRSPVLLPVPVSWLRWLGKLLNKTPAIERLVGLLAVDVEPIRHELGWAPPYSMQTGLAATVAWYHTQKANR
jgi:nucleoside-diphosphate-sugar epimerase